MDRNQVGTVAYRNPANIEPSAAGGARMLRGLSAVPPRNNLASVAHPPQGLWEAPTLDVASTVSAQWEPARLLHRDYSTEYRILLDYLELRESQGRERPGEFEERKKALREWHGYHTETSTVAMTKQQLLAVEAVAENLRLEYRHDRRDDSVDLEAPSEYHLRA
jgi:hypothetical protein